MPSCLGLSLFATQYKSPTGLERRGCPIRLKELNNAKKPSPTKLKGAQVARENYIRRRVATIKKSAPCFPNKKNPDCGGPYEYGPVFGIKKGPKFGGRGGECSNIYYANSGSGADIVQWKRLYGGSRTLFSTSACKYGCCKEIGNNGFKKGCVCYTISSTDITPELKIGDVLWSGKNGNTPPIDLYDAIVVSTSSLKYTVRCKSKFSFMSNKLAHGPVEATVYRRNTLNAWSKIANISGVFMNTPC